MPDDRERSQDHAPTPLGSHPHGHWTAQRPSGRAEDHVREVSGRVIRFMWDYGVTIPLWDEFGLLPDDPSWLRTSLGLSDRLIRDLGEWGAAMRYLDENRRIGSGRAYRDMDRRALALVERLGSEVGARFSITHDPWRVAWTLGQDGRHGIAPHRRRRGRSGPR